MIELDRVLFQMPRDRELQFAALAVVQKFVAIHEATRQANSNQEKRKNTIFRLQYDTTLGPDERQFFEQIGLIMKQPPGLDGAPDMLVDLREERILQFQNLGKHAAQICGILCGVRCSPLPDIRRLRPKTEQPYRWGRDLDGNEIAKFKSAEWTGIVGAASWGTYLAASMGLPVIEILPPGRHRNWLSKYVNTAYRVVDPQAGRVEEQISAAIESVEQLLRTKAEYAAKKAVAELIPETPKEEIQPAHA